MTHFESLIDPTDFGTVRRTLTNARTSITDILFVRDEAALAALAQLLTDEPPTDAQRAQFARWVRSGQIRVGVHHPVSSDESGNSCIDVEAIADETRCWVLFLPPFYLVHLRPPHDPAVGQEARVRNS